MKTNFNFQFRFISNLSIQFGISILFIVFMLICTLSKAQNYSKFYYPFSHFEFDDPATYITQKFYPSTNNPAFQFDGTLMIQRVVETGTGKDPIQVTTVDDMGNFVRSFFAFTDADGEFVPTCAAYNAYTHRYCIAGIHNATGISGSPIGSWFMILSENGFYIDAKEISIAVGGSSADNNFFVTDITSSEIDLHSEFVFVGVVGNATDPSPVAGSAATIQKTICIGGLDSYSNAVNFGIKRLFDFASPTDWDINNQFFPTRIIELPFANSDGGYLIAGSSVDGSLFFTRTHFNFTDNGLTEIYKYTDHLFAGDLRFDPVQSEVWFAGEGLSNESNYFIYQKVVNLTSPGVQLYSDALSTCVTTPDYFLRYNNIYEPTRWTKVSKIMPSSVNDEGVIASNTYNSTIYSTPRTYTYPNLHRINYSDLGLSGFCIGSGMQFPDLYTYPRWVGNIGYNNYLNYLTYNKLFYSPHTAHELPYNTFNDETFVMGSSTNDFFTSLPPEHIVLTRTSNFFANDCYQYYLPMVPLAFQSTQTSINPTDINSDLIGPYDLEYDTDFTIDVNDCINDNVFKQSKIYTQHDFNSYYEINFIDNFLIIKSKLMSSNYKLFNSVGQLVKSGQIVSGYSRDEISGLSAGMYFVEVLSSQNEKIGVKKIIVN